MATQFPSVVPIIWLLWPLTPPSSSASERACVRPPARTPSRLPACHIPAGETQGHTNKQANEAVFICRTGTTLLSFTVVIISAKLLVEFTHFLNKFKKLQKAKNLQYGKFLFHLGLVGFNFWELLSCSTVMRHSDWLAETFSKPEMVQTNPELKSSQNPIYSQEIWLPPTLKKT